MPIYEYACAACRKQVSVFQRSINTATAPRCPECGGDDLARLISKFAFHRGMPDFELGSDFDDEGMMDGVDENDPRAVAQWARKMGDKMGSDLPPDFDEQLARMEGGEMSDDAGDDGGEWDD